MGRHMVRSGADSFRVRHRLAGTIGVCIAAIGVGAPAAHGQTVCEDVSGEWTVEAAIGPGTQQVTVTIEQTECEIAGVVKGDRETPFEGGSVEESAFTFTTNVVNQADGESIAIVWQGTVDGDAVSGTLTAGVPIGEFSGTRGG